MLVDSGSLMQLLDVYLCEVILLPISLWKFLLKTKKPLICWQNDLAYSFLLFPKASNGKFNVTEIMDTWTRQMGYPVLNVTRQGNAFVIGQKRFLLDPTPDFSREKYTSPFGYVVVCCLLFVRQVERTL